MDIKLLKSDILSNNIPNFMIFVMNEQCLCKQYITYMSDTLNKPYKYYDSADGVIYDITTNMRDDYFYIILNDKAVVTNPSYVDKLVGMNRNIIVCVNDVDKTSNFYKNNKNYFVFFDRLDKYTLLAYAQKLLSKNKIAVDQDKLLTLIDYCNCDLGIMLNELDKIICLAQDNSNVLVDYMLVNGFSDYRSVNIFKFMQKVLDGDKTAFSDYLKIDDSPVGLLYSIYNQSKDRLLNTKNTRYLKYMQLCYKLYSGVVDGTVNDKYAMQYFLNEVLL